MSHQGVLTALAAALLALPSAAQAASPGFDLERLTPDVGATRSQVLSTGDGLAKGTVRVSLVLHYEKDPLVFYKDGARVGALVGDRLSAHLGGAWAPLDWLEVGLAVPVVLYQHGDTLTSEGMTSLSGTAFGTAVAQGRFTFFRQERGAPVDFGLTLGLGLPLGTGAAYTKDTGSGLQFLPRLGVGRSFGLIRVGAEVGAAVHAAARLTEYSQTEQDQVGSLLILGASATTTNDGVRGELTVRGLVPLSQTGGSFEILAGARYGFARSFEVFALLGPGLGALPGEAAFRVLGGVAWTPLAPPSCAEGQPYALSDCPALDRDGDGVRNGLDACPEQAGLAALSGCPDRDDDGDGVLNLADACPTQAGPAARGGCPVPDRDGDGVPDELDACPDERGVAGAKGCPDRDGDGVPDAQDQCPDVAGPNGGCADVDSDGDGIVDRLDACPQAAGSDEHGCGPAPMVAIAGPKLQLADKVQFELNKAVILPGSLTILDAAAKALLAHPELARVRIEGHTDDSGPKAYNVKLSQDRADAVKAYLVKQGVPAERIDAKGFGPERPLVANDSAQNREKNRRVEFVVDGQ